LQVVGKQTFLTWNDTAPHAVNYVAFATGWGATGKWKVTRGILLKLCLFVFEFSNRYNIGINLRFSFFYQPNKMASSSNISKFGIK
jgi:uncharacterized integral membrane protein